jgi:hypothetical protein
MSHEGSLKLFNMTVLLVIVAATVGACGKSAAPALQVGATDSGRQFTVHVGQTLALNMGTRGRGPWVLSYPRSLLRLTSASRDKGRFRLLAHRVGGAKLVLWPSGGCGFPNLDGPNTKCPIAQVGDRPARPFSVTLQILK